MNILFLAKESHVGGLLNYTYNMARGLSVKDNTSVVIGISSSPANEPLKSFNLHEIDFETSSPIKVIKNYLKIVRIIKDYKIDIIQTHNRVTALYAWFYCSFHKKVKYLWVSLSVQIPSSFLYRITTKYGACAIAGTEGVKLLEENLRIPKDKIKIMHLGIDFSKFTRTSPVEQSTLKNSLGIKQNEKVILLYGRLDKIKGHEYLLNSLRWLKNCNYKVIFPGENQEYKDYLLNIISKYNLEEKVIFPGFINGREYLSITDLMVLPSVKDGVSYAFIETISMGVPVIRTNAGGDYEDIRDLCFWVDYGDEKSLSQLIDDFLIGDEKFSKKAAQATIGSRKYSLENVIEEYYNLYCSILETK
ncbi:MAG: glycosyltransferase family 4 protein [Clostridium lundense]|nr:glycosyltransferase family 4 protein [Clostridium lundense]